MWMNVQACAKWKTLMPECSERVCLHLFNSPENNTTNNGEGRDPVENLRDLRYVGHVILSSDSTGTLLEGDRLCFDPGGDSTNIYIC